MKTPEEMAEEYCEDHDECEHARNAFLAGYKAAKDQLADAGKVMPQWVAVAQKWPDKTGRYLVFVQHPDTFCAYDIGYYEKGMWFDLRYVTHWMPLPEAPKGEG